MVAALALGTGAATSGTHPFCIFIDGLDVVKQPGSPGGIFGTLVDTVVVEDTVGQASTMEFTIDDPLKALNLQPNANVYFCDHTGRKNPDGSGTWITDDLFRGFILSATKEPMVTGYRWRVTAVSLEALLDRKVLTSGIINKDLGVSVSMPTGAAIQQVMSTCDPRISALSVDTGALTIEPSVGTLIRTAGSFFLRDSIPLTGKTYRQAVQEIALASANTINFYAGDAREYVDIDVQGRVRWLHDDLGFTPLATITEGDPTVTLAPEGIEVNTDTSQLVNAVYIRGVDAISSGWFTDDASIATYGRIEAFVDAPDCTSSTGVQDRGRAVVSQHKALTRISFNISGSHDSFFPVGSTNRAGWNTHSTKTSLAGTNGYWTPTTYTLHSVTKRFQGGGAHMAYELHYNSGYQSTVASLVGGINNDQRSASRLQGTLGEVAVRSKAGIPSDADFDVPRDGFVVLDTSTPTTIWVRSGGVWAPMDSAAIETSITAGVNITALTEGTADTIVTSGSAITCDGVSGIEVRFQSWSARPDNTVAGRQLVLVLYEDGASIGQLARLITPAAAGDDKPVDIARKFAPTAGSHTYSIRGFVTAGTGAVSAGVGGSGAAMPARLSVKRYAS